MCEVVDAFSRFTGEGASACMSEGQTELLIPFIEEDEMMLDNKFYELGAQLYCEHPDTDWHLMEVPQGKALRCPAGTNIKIVLPEPFKL